MGSARCGYYDSHPLMLLAVIHLFALSLYKQSKVYCPVFSINEHIPIVFLIIENPTSQHTHIIQKQLERDHRLKGEK